MYFLLPLEKDYYLPKAKFLNIFQFFYINQIFFGGLNAIIHFFGIISYFDLNC